MARSFDRLGSDLALTRFTGAPSPLPLEQAHSWGALDLALVPSTRGRPPRATGEADLGVVAGRANLGQALIVRLLTPRGSLAGLGHPSFGSRLGELIGRRNDAATRNLARLYVLEALAEEPRIAAVDGLEVGVDAAQPDAVRIELLVLPRGDDDPLALALELAL